MFLLGFAGAQYFTANARRMPAALKSLVSNFYLFCFVWTVAVIYFKLGRHGGSWLGYLFHLITPFLLILTALSVRGLPRWRFLFSALIIFNFFTITVDHSFAKHLKRLNSEPKEWNVIESLVASHQNIFNSPAITGMLVEHHRQVYDSGQSDVFKIGAYRNSFLKHFSRPDGRITARYYAYLFEIMEKVKRKEFDAIIITRNYAPMMSGDLLNYYRYIGTIPVAMPHSIQKWDLTIWLPKP